jgi:UDP-2,4-diacetamido-2,4,6-trideoxy-beta-L-altropyranose hydrolase
VTRRVVLRADASAAIGTGHVMRCLTLAEEMIARGWSATLLAAELPDALVGRVRSAGLSLDLVTAAEPGDLSDAAAVIATEADAVVLDSYRFGVAYRKNVRAAGRPVMTLDDGPTLPALHADLVINPAPHADAERYAAVAPGAQLLLGPGYALVRCAIREAAGAVHADAGQRSRLLVLFGGSDPLGLTAPVATALQRRLPSDVMTVVVGAAAAPMNLAGLAPLRDPPNLPDLMVQSGLAISAAGGTLGELAVCGVPTIAAVVADNQAAAATTMAGWGVAIDARAEHAVDRLVDEALRLWRDPETRTRMGRAARATVDGLGAVRAVDALSAKLDQCARC